MNQIYSSPIYPLCLITSLRKIKGVILTLAILLLSSILTSCVKNEFMMRIELPADVNSTYRLTYYASDPRGGLQIETAVAVAQGKAEIKGVTRYPTLVVINTGTSAIPAAIFYAERGDEIKISGPGRDPLEWSIDGNKVNKELTAWRLENRDVINDARRTYLSSDYDTYGKKLNAKIAEYVKQNAGSKAALFILYSYFDASLQPGEFNSLSHLTEESGIADDYTALLARQDITTSSLSSATGESGIKLKDLILRTTSHADTVRLSKSKIPTLIYWWQNNDERRKETADSLKRLERWRPDSTSMAIVDIALTSDSSTWAYNLRRDSLRHTVRAFAPAGFADPDAMQLGVRSTPWFIVVSAKGKIIYSGADIEVATRKFRSLKPSSKS